MTFPSHSTLYTGRYFLLHLFMISNIGVTVADMRGMKGPSPVWSLYLSLHDKLQSEIQNLHNAAPLLQIILMYCGKTSDCTHCMELAPSACGRPAYCRFSLYKAHGCRIIRGTEQHHAVSLSRTRSPCFQWTPQLKPLSGPGISEMIAKQLID